LGKQSTCGVQYPVAVRAGILAYRWVRRVRGVPGGVTINWHSLCRKIVAVSASAGEAGIKAITRGKHARQRSVIRNKQGGSAIERRVRR